MCIYNRMKQKYAFSLHFFRISPKKGEEQKIWDVLKEYQEFSLHYWRYCFYFNYTSSQIHSLVASSLSLDLQEALKDSKLNNFIDYVKMIKAKDTFIGMFFLKNLLNRCKVKYSIISICYGRSK